MNDTLIAPVHTRTGRGEGLRARLSRAVLVGMEGVVLLLVALSPWAFGGVEPPVQYALFAAVALVLFLWALRVLLDGRFLWKKCPVLLCLAALLLLGVCQMIPLPRSVLHTLSPATSRLYEQLLPEQPEKLPDEVLQTAPLVAPGTTLSLYPGATIRELFNLLAVCLLFAAVRNNLTEPAAFRRFAGVTVANGFLLSLFALIQFFTSSHHVVYWTYPSEGEVFGPFICRNHFPFYVNVGVGFGIGALLALKGGQRSSRAENPLHDPRVLWIGSLLVLMIAAIALSLSRGGMLALFGATALSLALASGRWSHRSGLGAVGVIAVLALLVVAWFGLGRVEARLATVVHDETYRGDRVALWSRLLPLASDYPIWGTGYGTFDYMEQLTRTTGADTGTHWEHAHNDYLEAWLEGGVVRLFLTLLTLGILCTLSWRAYTRHPRGPSSGLALGGLFGLIALALHSFVDFGLHIPAIAILAAVLAAHLAGLRNTIPGKRVGQRSVQEPTLPLDHFAVRMWGFAPLTAAILLLALGLTLHARGWREYMAWRSRQAAADVQGSTLTQREQSIGWLETASVLTPESGPVQAQLAVAHLQLFRDATGRMADRTLLGDAVQLLGDSAAAAGPTGGIHPVLPLGASWLAGTTIRQERLGAMRRELARRHQVPGLQHLLQARAACPLLAGVQLQLALHANEFASAQPPEAYLARARMLAPDDPEVWYLSGFQELQDEKTEQAWTSWQRSLELSPHYLPDIVAGIGRTERAQEGFEHVLPPRPALWLTAAEQLYPNPDAVVGRRPFLEKAGVLLAERAGSLTAEEWHSQGLISVALGRPVEALVAYQKALDQEPSNLTWRCDLARTLDAQGRLDEARKELLSVLAVQPGHTDARVLLERIARELAEKR